MAIKKKTAKPLTAAHKKKILDQIAAAEKSLKALDASVTTMRKEAVAASYVGGKPMRAKARRRKR
jgi:hypothetical protein